MGLVYTFTLLLVVSTVSQAFFQSQRYPHTHNQQALNGLYNQRIQSIQEYRRPLDIKPVYGVDIAKHLDKIGINHRGQVATLQDGQKFLVHKGPGFGHNSQTVVVDTQRTRMSSKWKPHGSPVNAGSQSVGLGDLVKAGGKDYSYLCNNCIRGSNRMKERFQNGK
ncbi:unnamed protein product [Adineta ricciae]|uniref:Uncharacterized protein n=1 Tax=Adineta ricciae TaxID=249248 RepID=A0A815MQL8_ADIRI|nr:unnamed protein product [Adineta ricciae]CAF1426495.1 unnamed protein product [Adineta ricciae]